MLYIQVAFTNVERFTHRRGDEKLNYGVTMNKLSEYVEKMIRDFQ